MSKLTEINMWVADEHNVNDIYKWIRENCNTGYLINACHSWDGNTWKPYIHAMIPEDRLLMFKLTWGGR